MVFEDLTGSQELRDMRANQMMEHWAKSKNWVEVDLKDAHKLANEGEIVMVGWHSQSAKSGHVAMVVPGELQDSGWKCKRVPLTMDTGSEGKWTSDKLSRGFGTGKEDSVKFYRYKEPTKK